MRILTETQETEPFVMGLREPGWSRETKVWVDGVPVYCGKETLSKAGEPCRAAGMSGDADGMPARAAEMPEAQPEGMLPKEAGELCGMAGVLGQNQEALSVTRKRGYILLEGVWQGSHEIVVELDMRTEAVRPIPYGHDILMTRIVWEENYVVSVYDEETLEAKERVCLRRGRWCWRHRMSLDTTRRGCLTSPWGRTGMWRRRRQSMERGLVTTWRSWRLRCGEAGACA